MTYDDVIKVMTIASYMLLFCFHAVIHFAGEQTLSEAVIVKIICHVCAINRHPKLWHVY